MAEGVLDAFDLSGKVAVVTGAGSGVGRAAAVVLAGAGAIVYCADVSVAAAAQTAAAIVAGGGRAVERSVDVGERSEMDALVDDVLMARGRLDVMCNVAGEVVGASFLELDGDQLDDLMRVNLRGVLHGCQAAARVMAGQPSGSIVNVAVELASGHGTCTVSEAALTALSRSLATELGAGPVRVNAVTVATGSAHTRSFDVAVDSSAASCLLYLASDASATVTGQCLRPAAVGASA